MNWIREFMMTTMRMMMMGKKPDYTKQNYCRICELVFPKSVTRCLTCKRMLRKSQKKHKQMLNFPRN